MALLEIESLSKTFPGQRALVELSLSVERGEGHAIVGQNGSGKSTLMKILPGYHQPGAGAACRVVGEPTSFADLVERVPVRAVHQDLGIIGALSAVDNLAL